MEKNLISLIGLGAIGVPLANLLYKKYGDNFVLLSDEAHASKLKKNKIYINDEIFSPKIATCKEELNGGIDAIFVCVKNYSLHSAASCFKDLINKNTIIIPLQNGVYSYFFLKEYFPNNIVLEAFAQGPNTQKTLSGFVYQNTGVYHVGTSDNGITEYAEKIYDILTFIGIDCIFHENIQHEVWKKLMLNVAGNALTAITEIDYSMFKNSKEAQLVCRKVMYEFKSVANSMRINIRNDDIEDVMEYFITYNGSKKTSMLEDVLNRRETENEYLAGFIKKIAQERGLQIPYIDLLYYLMKVKEDVYLEKLN